ncbi:MAG TPA: hypothetical protein DEQ02_02395 [Ruminococcaceae bacterium]|nr:hypothetical protein [Oscillospiraceae bacterium]
MQDLQNEEIIRLKKKVNSQIAVIEGQQRRIELLETICKKMENSSVFIFSSLVDFCKENNKSTNIYRLKNKTKNSESYIYIPLSALYEYFEGITEEFNKKSLLEFMQRMGFLPENPKEWTTSYNRQRVLKISAEKYDYLVEGI